MARSNQEFIAGDRVVVNLDTAESAIVVALDEQADRDHNAVIKLKRVNNPPLGLRLGRVISSDVPKTQDIERRLEKDSKLTSFATSFQKSKEESIRMESDSYRSATFVSHTAAGERDVAFMKYI